MVREAPPVRREPFPGSSAIADGAGVEPQSPASRYEPKPDGQYAGQRADFAAAVSHIKCEQRRTRPHHPSRRARSRRIRGSASGSHGPACRWSASARQSRTPPHVSVRRAGHGHVSGTRHHVSAVAYFWRAFRSSSASFPENLRRMASMSRSLFSGQCRR